MAWGMEELLEQIRAEVELREEHKVSAGTNKKPQEGTAVKSSASSLVVSNGQGTCVYCLGKHSSEKCEEIKLPVERARKATLPVVRREWVCINAFGQRNQKGALREVVEFSVNPVNGGNSISMQAFVVPEISYIHNSHVELVRDQFPHLEGLWFSDVNRVQDQPSEQTECLDREIAKLWDLETLGIRETRGVQEEFLDNISFNGERYSVKLPWKVNHKPLPTNNESSLGRLHSTMRKFRQEPEVLDQYEAVIKNQLEAGVIEPVHALEEGNKIHYLAHRAVVRRHIPTSTPVIVIYDESAKTGKGGVSLNDCLHVGPSLNALLFNVLLRFRLHRIALTADIEKAFLNIEVDLKDRDCLRFLFPEDPRKEDSVIKV
ncbi:uncharacterized protein LOC116617947 [Nematostella vectensis]|uniref:uncharacterized protein LOC116617947 n=1 Tax=Nematostella vectensis TaxID=45351 RepID=UPI0013902210|nr:uncharacterized protein LOC116617947 [Nematostella vectensis]